MEESENRMPQKRHLPKLVACITKASLENMRNKALFCLDVLDAKGIRRRKLPLHECLLLELREAGFVETADYFQDLLYDNSQLVAEDEIGIVVDIRKQPVYLEHICEVLVKAEKKRDKEEEKKRKDIYSVSRPHGHFYTSKSTSASQEETTAEKKRRKKLSSEIKKECLHILGLALEFAEKGKGILWLAEKFFLAAIAVSSQYLVDGGRQKGCCRYHYAKFLLDKFPGTDVDEPYQILTDVRDCAIGKTWPLYECSEENPDEEVPPDILFECTAVQLHRVLLSKSRAVRKTDTARSERLARLAERRARDANDVSKVAEAIIEIGVCQLAMNNLNNAQKTFERAYAIYTQGKNIQGLCDTKMHMAAVMQRMGNHEKAAKLLTEMGALAMEYGLRRHLGRALHLLGELHLRREKPELGTQHLAEAFTCFMGTGWQNPVEDMEEKELLAKSKLNCIYKAEVIEIFEEEAEQSRLMMAISKGQEYMASFFDVVRECTDCSIAQVKLIEWKLENAPWWVKKRKHDLLPCMCAEHHRSPLDILRIKLEMLRDLQEIEGIDTQSQILRRFITVEDIRKLHSNMES